MNIFIDCEWNDYRGPLISMALVAEDGREFYEMLECENPSPWIVQNVMPILNKAPIARVDFVRKLEAFVTSFDSIHLIADWPEDIEHFCKALIVGPGQRVGPGRWTMEVNRLPPIVSEVPHNALEDARSIAKYFKAA